MNNASPGNSSVLQFMGSAHWDDHIILPDYIQSIIGNARVRCAESNWRRQILWLEGQHTSDGRMDRQSTRTSLRLETMWSLMSPCAKRISGPKKFRSSPEKDFFN